MRDFPVFNKKSPTFQENKINDQAPSMLGNPKSCIIKRFSNRQYLTAANIFLFFFFYKLKQNNLKLQKATAALNYCPFSGLIWIHLVNIYCQSGIIKGEFQTNIKIQRLHIKSLFNTTIFLSSIVCKIVIPRKEHAWTS